MRLLKVPYRLMFPAILIFCASGSTRSTTTPADVISRRLRPRRLPLIKFGFEPAPLLLGFVLGRLMEEKLRQALTLSREDPMVFVERPVALVLFALSPYGRGGPDCRREQAP